MKREPKWMAYLNQAEREDLELAEAAKELSARLRYRYKKRAENRMRKEQRGEKGSTHWDTPI